VYNVSQMNFLSVCFGVTTSSALYPSSCCCWCFITYVSIGVTLIVPILNDSCSDETAVVVIIVLLLYSKTCLNDSVRLSLRRVLLIQDVIRHG